MLAKIQGAKRKRIVDDEEDVEMDDDDDDDDVSGSDNAMDVDDGESAPKKRVKTNSGGVIHKRAPRSNRQTAGLRDEGVSFAQMCLFKLFA
jgi:nucleolar GTP-binding protein